MVIDWLLEAGSDEAWNDRVIAARNVDWFDSIDDTHKLRDRDKGHPALQADKTGWKLLESQSSAGRVGPVEAQPAAETSPARSPPVTSISSPSATRITRVASRNVLCRCVTMIIVHPQPCSSRAAWIRSSLSTSIWLVASRKRSQLRNGGHPIRLRGRFCHTGWL